MVTATPVTDVPAMAARLEAAGWTGVGTVDSQNLAPDPYVYLTMAATGTNTLGLMTSVTNVVTRHPAATATAALTVQAVSGGRFVLGIGRGDSALAHIGHSPARLAWFERYLKTVAAYVKGHEVDFEDVAVPDHVSPPVDELDLADHPTISRIRWAKTVTPVPIEVSATGPRVIGAAARHADRILLAVGAQPERIAWGIETARRAAEDAGRDPDALSFGAYVSVVCDEDVERARRAGLGTASLFARFSVMHGTVSGPADDAQTKVFTDVHANYNMKRHARGDGAQTTVLTDEFLDSFAILGSVEHCVDRLGALAELGIDKFAITGTRVDGGGPETTDAAARLIEQVVPQVR